MAGFDAGIWIGLLGPAELPKAIVDVLAAVSIEALKTDALVKSLDAQGIDAIGTGPAGFARFIGEDIEKWSKVVQAAGLHE